MSLYHQLETVEIPTIGQFRIQPLEQDEEVVKPNAQFAPPASLRLDQQSDEEGDPFITKRDQPAQVETAIPVSSVSNRIFGNGSGDKKTQKRLVYDQEDVPA